MREPVDYCAAIRLPPELPLGKIETTTEPTMPSQATSTASFALRATLVALSTTAALWAQTDAMRALHGEWVYVEDRTEGRALERLGPPMSTSFALQVEQDAIVLVRGHGSGHRNVRVALDGTLTEVEEAQKTTRYRGSWNDGTFVYEVDFLRGADSEPGGLIHREFRVTDDGLEVRATSATAAGSVSVALYRHAEDIPMPTPAEATIADLAWLADAWVGSRSSGATIEERWSPPLGGSMLGVSRTVSRGRLSGFEFLRIVERDGGLVYIAQPGGGAATEFVMTERTASRAVFDNPRHDYPKRITYELSDDGTMHATIGFLKGGTPRRFEYRRETR